MKFLVISSLKYASDRPPVGIADALRIREKVQADAVSCDQKKTMDVFVNQARLLGRPERGPTLNQLGLGRLP